MSDNELKVTFYPPLFLQRRMWILEVMRRESVTRVLDVGCGEGQLLSVLCQPAPWLEPPTAATMRSFFRAEDRDNDEMSTDRALFDIEIKDEIANLHPTYIAGLDISVPDLDFAIETTAPPLTDAPEIRWEPLQAKIWKGGLEVVNPEFVDVECIVSTEVIEHLPQEILADFAPILLGVYHPRLLLITTPSYTFNARFTAPGEDSTRTGYLDPTGRTTRVFRHDDHKFEWTVEEFRQWCGEVADEWGYSVKVSSVGRATEEDEWGRDEELGGASQVAEFKRDDDNRFIEIRKTKVKALLEQESAKHELLATHNHVAHPNSQQPVDLQVIGEAVRKKMEGYREGFMRLEELWFERDIAILCGGWIEMLIIAVHQDEKLNLQKPDPDRRTTWQVVHIESGSDSMWLPVGETSVDYIPSNWIPEEDTRSQEEWDNTSTSANVSWTPSEGNVQADLSGRWDSEDSLGWEQDSGTWASISEGDGETLKTVAWDPEEDPWKDAEGEGYRPDLLVPDSTTSTGKSSDVPSS